MYLRVLGGLADAIVPICVDMEKLKGTKMPPVGSPGTEAERMLVQLPDIDPVIDDRRVAIVPPHATRLPGDARTAKENRRRAPRMKVFKGGHIVWLPGTSVECIIRNLSETGAMLEVYSPVPRNFELIFDGDESRHPCRVIWQKDQRLGVEFVHFQS